MLRKYSVVKVGNKFGAQMKTIFVCNAYLSKTGDYWHSKLSSFESFCCFDTQEAAEERLRAYLSLKNPIIIKEVK